MLSSMMRPLLLATLLAPALALPPVQDATPKDDPIPKALFQYPGAPFEATGGDLWFATVGAGIVRHDGTAFKIYTHANSGLASDFIRGIVEDDEGVLWVGTTGGVSRFDGTRFHTLTDYGDVPATRTISEDGDHRDIWDVIFDRHGTMWISTMGGVFRRDGTRFVPFPMPVTASPGEFEFTRNMVYEIYEDREGALWFATDGAGAIKIDGEATTIYTKKTHGLASDRVCTILKDARGDVWFGTSDGGVSRLKDSKFTTHLRAETRSIHTGWGRYMSIHEDRAGNVWFGVSMIGGGVHRFDGETFRYFGEKDGLGIGGVPSINEDKSGTLWLGTTAGVYRLERDRFVPLSTSPKATDPKKE